MSGCSTGLCKSSDLIWGVIHPKSNRLHRLSFSRGLTEYVIGVVGDDYDLARFTYTAGKRLQAHEISKTGLYGIVSENKNIMLRVQLQPETADLLTRDDSRYIAEVSLIRVH